MLNDAQCIPEVIHHLVRERQQVLLRRAYPVERLFREHRGPGHARIIPLSV